MLHKMIRNFAPLAAIAMSAALAGCDGMDVRINDEDAVPLAELDMSGAPPTELALVASDTVILTEGDTLDITLEGDEDAIEALRFTNSDGTLGIVRESGRWKDTGQAIVRVTMPAPEAISIAGSGSVESARMATNAAINIAGSGSVDVSAFDSEMLEVSMGGSGKVTGTGSAERIEISSAGSGQVDLAGLTTERAEVSIVGSGDVRFASDGDVEASIAGSGSVYVTGSATCTVSSVGSGKLVCENKSAAEAAEEEVATKKAAAKAKQAKAKKKAAKKVAKKAGAKKPRKA